MSIVIQNSPFRKEEKAAPPTLQEEWVSAAKITYEATSSVDVDSEAEIWECIEKLSKIRTLVIISHRLSSIKDSDMIYILDKGKLIESGKHDSLMAASGLYRSMTDEQEELYREGGVLQ